MSETIVQVENLSLRFRNKILQDSISFNWKINQTWCVTGATGSGKTTFLKMIAGHIFSSRADINYPYLEKYKRKSNCFINDLIAFVPQEIKIPTGYYIEDLYHQRRFQAAEQDEIPTAFEILLRVSKSEEIVKEVAKQMYLTDILTQPFVQLSNGQTRRLMIAIALCKQPKILILDNPYTGLDQRARVKLNEIIDNLIKSGVPVLIAAHEHELPLMDFVTDVLKLKPVMVCNDTNDTLPTDLILKKENQNNLIIEMRNIKVRYGDKTVLDIPEWKVKRGDKWVIQGENGSGKSTLLSVIMADHPQAYSNEIYLFGRKRGTGESIWDIKSRIGYFSPELLRYIESRQPAKQIILSGMNNLYISQSHTENEKEDRLERIAGWLGITQLLEIPFGDLSLGQQKMILITNAMIRNPELLILDEPLQGMDIEWREHFKRKINQFSKERTVLYVTHDEEEIPSDNWERLRL